MISFELLTFIHNECWFFSMSTKLKNLTNQSWYMFELPVGTRKTNVIATGGNNDQTDLRVNMDNTTQYGFQLNINR